jgi:hypothetical protein
MRTAILFSGLIAAVAIAASTPAHAAEYRWCAQYVGSGGDMGRNCGFSTLAQCQATVHGVGGYCELNPRYAGERRKTRSTTGSGSRN